MIFLHKTQLSNKQSLTIYIVIDQGNNTIPDLKTKTYSEIKKKRHALKHVSQKNKETATLIFLTYAIYPIARVRNTLKGNIIL